MDPFSAHQTRKTRSACDRCHSQKLRCVRRAGQSHCERCLRLDGVCRFAPRARRGSKKTTRIRPEAAPVSTMQSTFNTLSTPSTVLDSAMDLAWPIADESWIESLDLSTTDVANQDIQRPDNAYHLDSAWPLVGSGMGSAVQPLATIHTALDPQPVRSPALTGTHELANLSIALCRSRQDLPFIFDDLFNLTTQFTHLIKRRSLSTDPEDESTALMLGSCYSRLTGIYSTIFSLIHCCIEHSAGTPRPRPAGALILPNVQLGPLSSPSLHVDMETPLSLEKAVMYISMIVVFSAQLWGQLADVVRERQVGTERSLVSNMWNEMREKVDGLLKTIDSTRSYLVDQVA
ncbi:hypothetical protein BJX63DRAFT_39434 [Aspergillus granulosus]|uniref:Zn(2)-C6 fungal-type domain-containing protein n=1 Tax=Aspergillus granulosus TaxID=176169 RepID=A0ABR4GZ50_9EURO